MTEYGMKKNLSQQSVLIAVSGKRDSAVAAYLLKKQGFKCYAVTFLFAEEGPDAKNPVRCQQANLQTTKAIFDQLEIPFYAVRAQKQYKAEVIDPMISATLSGRMSAPCLACNRLKFDLLLEKAELLKVDFIATGHYSKIVKNDLLGEYSLITANDLEHDQSFFLSALKSHHLKKLILPLSDVKHSEVAKIAQSLGITLPESSPTQKEMCYVKTPDMKRLVETFAAPSLFPDGDMFRLDDDVKVASHDGAHGFYVGQNHLQSNKPERIDPELTVMKMDVQRGKIYLGKPNNFSFNYVSLMNIQHDEFFDLTKPLHVYLFHPAYLKRVEATVFLKNVDTALVLLKDFQIGIIPIGAPVVCYNKAGIGGKILLLGEIAASGNFKEYSRINVEEKGDLEKTKVRYDGRF